LANHRQAKSGNIRTAQKPADGEHAEFAELWRPAEGQTPHRGPERVLLERGLITQEQLEQAAILQKDKPRLTILQTLVQSGAVEDMLAHRAVSQYFKLPFMRITPADVDENVFELLNIEYIKAKQIIPIRRDDDDNIVVGIADPADIFLIDDLKRRLKGRLSLAVVPPGDIAAVMEELAASPVEHVDEIIKNIAEDAVEVVDRTVEDVTDLERIAGESPVIRYVNYLITQAVKEDASDIHIEPGEKRLRVRYRIDGVLFEQKAPPSQMHAAIVSRLKIMADLDISERRLPQDGRIRASVRGHAVDLRVSTLPIIHGEKCVIRILDNRSILIGLDKLGMQPDTLQLFEKEILQPHGIVLVTGPTGSGKSTTLYSAIRIMDGDRLNIATVEDPVEYELDFANQVNVHESIGLTFAAALRSLLRQDPDVIMVGEIRDDETARIAIQASLTGHLVLSTLHTNDSPSSITRLINIGVEPYLISASVNAVLAQRLVRKICPYCKTRVKSVRDNVQAYLQKYNAKASQLFQGAGCEKCRQTGYKGRIGIYELFILDDDLRDVISHNPTLTELRRQAAEKGMRNLRHDGLAKVAAGQTTVEEVMCVTET